MSTSASGDTERTGDDKLHFDASKLTPEMRAMIAEFDRDNDGEIDINELLNAMQDLKSTRKSNKRMACAVGLMVVVVLLALLAIFAVCVGAAALIKDSKVNHSKGSDAAVLRAKSGGSDAESIVHVASVDVVSKAEPVSTTPALDEGTASEATSSVDSTLAGTFGVDPDLAKAAARITTCQTKSTEWGSDYVAYDVAFEIDHSAIIEIDSGNGEFPLTINLVAADGSATQGTFKRRGREDFVSPIDETVSLSHLDLTSSEGDLVRVCCSSADPTCYWALGSAPVERTNCYLDPESTQPDNLTCTPAEVTAARAINGRIHTATHKSRTSIRNLWYGPQPWLYLADDKQNPFWIETAPQEYLIPAATRVMAAYEKFVCRASAPGHPNHAQQSVYATYVHANYDHRWFTTTTVNNHMRMQPGTGGFENMASWWNQLPLGRAHMELPNPGCPTGLVPGFSHYATAGVIYYMDRDYWGQPFKRTYDIQYMNTVAGVTNVPAAICECIVPPVIGSSARGTADANAHMIRMPLVR